MIAAERLAQQREANRRAMRRVYWNACLDVEAETIAFLRAHYPSEPGYSRRISALRDRLCGVMRAMSLYGCSPGDRHEPNRMGRALWLTLRARYEHGQPYFDRRPVRATDD